VDKQVPLVALDGVRLVLVMAAVEVARITGGAMLVQMVTQGLLQFATQIHLMLLLRRQVLQL
jgi:hypothetical protein